MSDDKGYIQSAVDKTKEVVNDVKESLREGYTKMTGDRAEDRAADKVKNAADSCAQKAGECRDKISNKMHEGARHVESH